MWGLRTKKSKATQLWHSRAMAIDLRKTIITMVWDETPNTGEVEENLDIKEPDPAETLDSSPHVKENLAITEPNLDGTTITIDSGVSLEFTGVAQPETLSKNDPPQKNIEITEPSLPKASKANRRAVNLEFTEQNLSETNIPLCMEEAMLAESNQEPTNAKFLRALKRTRKSWENNKKFAKIVEKMQKGKNLKRKEFDKLYFLLREKGQCQ